MRLHTLTLVGFGPYADRQQVDFDELTDAGVFLLTGPTGAGKTSVLDAVCFALYGVVPGDREVGGLRSAHATPDVPTRVELELTLCGRRLRVERWPAWERPKRRGEGTTSERAGALLLEIGADGSERLVSSRVQEVGHELGPLLGMTSDQFMQVVLLPQGGFSTFLKADSDQRRVVLERLFATQRFTRIESWVHERAVSLRRTEEQARAELLELIAATAHRAGRARPDDLDDETLRAWRAEVLEQARVSVGAAAAAEVQARERCEQAHEAARGAEHRHALLIRRAGAERALLTLGESEDDARAAQLQLHDHQRAARVAPLLDPLDEAQVRLAQSVARAEQALAQLPEALDREACEDAVSDVQRRIGELSALEPLVARLDDARRRRAALQVEVAAADDELERCTRESVALPQRRAAIAARLDEARLCASRRGECERSAELALERRRAAEMLPAASRLLDELQEQARDAHERSNDALSAHLDLVERRLRGMAAELAGALEDGSACQVCGSTDHPAPASPSPAAVTREQQEAAESAAEESRRRHAEAQQRVAHAQQELAVLKQVAGGHDAQAATLAAQEAKQELQVVVVAAQQCVELVEELGEVDEQVAEAGRRTEAARERRDRLVHELAAAERVVGESEPQAQAVLGDEVSLAAASATAQTDLVLLHEVSRSLAVLDESRATEESWRRRADQAVGDTGFADGEQAGAALLSPDDVTRLETLLEKRREALARAEGVLVEPDVRALGEVSHSEGEADLGRTRDEASQASTALQEAVSSLRAAERAGAALVGLDDQLATAAAAWAPARNEHELADAMSRLVRGLGADNQLQMRLSSYVLATRLDQVLAAANERLQQMRDNRYTVHRSARAKAGKRAGLDIDVLDDWTGELRPPTSLSGGETFKLSLALALGLADVIKQESGGLEIETLFIDEGFGMLDPDTLDEVMDCVDDLRSGGRAVGVVSHVTELRSRVATQLHVTPSPRGSRISVATAAV